MGRRVEGPVLGHQGEPEGPLTEARAEPVRARAEWEGASPEAFQGDQAGGRQLQTVEAKQ